MTVTLDHITSSPEYHALIRKRNQIIWPLLLATVTAYIAFILAIAFEPAALGTLIFNGTVSIGIVIGLLLILFNFVITLLYVYRANRELQPLIIQVQTLAGR